ncbi:MAG: 4-hydroxy-tetrahydrodipicolinate synthase [Desulfobacterales bacterium]|jgi:4-hydroxy-tetrahydrodipicolinate synthase|nr:4-hydroxy-tetrahydrodipicolinate synthase [Desulfobacterales bacterium]
MIEGCFTAIITPFKNDTVDYDGLRKLSDFQIKNGITGILAVGTTGESPVLTWDEHNRVIETVAEKTRDKCLCIAGAGSNNTKESLEGTKHAVSVGADAVLLVDPYYNGPSSIEIRREYIAPVAEAAPGIEIISYVIPGRTGAQLLPEDLALLNETYGNFNTVKEATNDLENMRKTRKCCGPDFTILSGDDGMTFEMMTNPEIKASGVISVATNVAPKAISQMVQRLRDGDQAGAKELLDALKPLFDLVTVKTMEQTPFGEVVCRARNPLAYKTLMSILGMPSGGCRRPLGKMTRNGLETVLKAVRNVQANHPEILEPVAEFFNVDIEGRLNDPSTWDGLFYATY